MGGFCLVGEVMGILVVSGTFTITCWSVCDGEGPGSVGRVGRLIPGSNDSVGSGCGGILFLEV